MSTAGIPTVSQIVTQASIGVYAELSGDYNPLHVDEAFAAKTPFGGTIAHGPIALQTFLASLTEWFDSETLPAGVAVKVTYRAPVRPGDTIGFTPLAVADGEDDTTVTVEGECRNQRDEAVIVVSATVPRSVLPSAG